MANGLKVSRKKLLERVAAGDQAALGELRRREHNEALNAEQHANARKMRDRNNQIEQANREMHKPGGWYDLQGEYHNPEPEVIPEPKAANSEPFYVEPAKRKAGEYAAYLENTK